MPRLARVGDYHEGICDHKAPCCPHNVTGPIIEGSSDVNTNGKRQARLNDNIIHDCPHCGTGYIAEGSGTVYVNGKPIARIGGKVIYPAGSGVIVEASDNASAGD